MIPIICILIYVFIGSVTGRSIYMIACLKCDETNHAIYCMHEVVATILGALWPLGLPIYAGITVVNFAASRHAQRLEKLAAEQELAQEQKERTLADIQFLVENGIQAAVPGLYEEPSA